MTWEEAMRNYRQDMEPKQVFRHGISMIPVSRIAGQYYCEQKIEMDYTHGEIETEAKSEGTEVHDKLIRMTKSTRSDLIDHIKSRELVIASFPIIAKFANLTIAGIPDAVVFRKGILRYVVELKTTAGDTSRLWRDQLVQARVYGLILNQMGFDCTALKLVIVRMQRRNSLSEEEERSFLHELVSELLIGRSPKLTDSTVHTIAYDRKDAAADVDWAKNYWLSNREPVPTKLAGKCRACEFKDVCPFSLTSSMTEPKCNLTSSFSVV